MFLDKRILVPAIAVIMIVIACAASFADGSKLEPDDIIQVTIDDADEFTKPYQLDSEGNINLPMYGELNVLNMDTSEAAAAITNALKGDILVSPQVMVVYAGRVQMEVFVVGQVKKPGLVKIGTGQTLIQALAEAGYDDTADLSHITIQRGDEVASYDVSEYLSGEDLSQNPKLQSGDTVAVQRIDKIGSVTFSGAVKTVGPFDIRRDTTLREALGQIGGITAEADKTRVVVKRVEAAEPIAIDYEKAMEGDPQHNIVLRPGDTVYVPEEKNAFFTILGGVNRSGPYPIEDPISLSEAIAMAGGYSQNGDFRKVQLMRPGAEGMPGESKTYNLHDIMAKGGEEPMVERGDRIYVPIHKPKPTLLDTVMKILPFGWLFR